MSSTRACGVLSAKPTGLTEIPTPPGEYRYNVPPEEFARWEREGKDIWIRGEHGNRYVTLRESVDPFFLPGSDLPDSDFIGFMTLIPEVLPLLLNYAQGRGKVKSFYLFSPPEGELRRRLVERGEKEGVIEGRIKDCWFWDEEAKRSSIPYIFLRNDEPIVGIERAAREILKYCSLPQPRK